MIVLCTHHKGGVGKSERAIHLAGVSHALGKRTLLIDCDTQPTAFAFHTHSPPEVVGEPVAVGPLLSVLWNPERVKLQKLIDLASFDHVVLDVDSPLENTVQRIVDDQPEKIFVPVNPQAGALTSLCDPLRVVERLERTTDFRPKVRVVPLGSDARLIKKELARIAAALSDCKIADAMPRLDDETNKARAQRKYVWRYRACADLKGYYERLLLG